MPKTHNGCYESGPPQETHLWDCIHALLGRRRAVLSVFFAVVALAILRTLLMEPVYEGTAQILIERTDANIINSKEVAHVDSAKEDYFQTQYKLLQSRSLARCVIETLNLLNNPEYGGPRTEDQITALLAKPPGQARELAYEITTFLKRLSVRPVRNSHLVDESVSSGSPELAARMANTLSRVHIQQSLGLRFQTSSEAGHWLGTQIADQRAKGEDLDRQLQALRRQEGLVNIDKRRTLLDQRLKELGTALNERKTERLQREVLWRQMASTENPEELPELLRSPLVKSLRIELATLERQEAQLLERYLEQHHEVVKVRNQTEDTKVKIRAEAERIIRAAKNDYKAAAALGAAKQEVLDLDARAVTHDSQKREVEVAEQFLDSLLGRAKSTDVASELKSTNIRIFDPAVVPERPIRPRKVRDIALGILSSVFLAVGLAFFLEYLDNTIKTRDATKRHLGAPLLGAVPETQGKGRRQPSHPQRLPQPAFPGGLPCCPHCPWLLLERFRLPSGRGHVNRLRGRQEPHGYKHRPDTGPGRQELAS